MTKVLFSDTIIQIPQTEIDLYQAQFSKLLQPKPDDKALVPIYEIHRIIDLTGIRAEKWDSVEWRDELAKYRAENPDFKVARGVYNPNYAKLLENLTKLTKIRLERQKKAPDNLEAHVSTVQELIKNVVCVCDLGHNNEYTVARLSYIPDIRLISQLPTVFNYLYTRTF